MLDTLDRIEYYLFLFTNNEIEIEISLLTKSGPQEGIYK